MRNAAKWLNLLRNFFRSEVDKQPVVDIVDNVSDKSDLDGQLFRSIQAAGTQLDVYPGPINERSLAAYLSVQCVTVSDRLHLELGYTTSTRSLPYWIKDRAGIQRDLEYRYFFGGYKNSLVNHKVSQQRVRFMRFVTVRCKDLTCTLLNMRHRGGVPTATSVYDGYLQYSQTGIRSTSIDAICEAMDSAFAGTSSSELINPEKNRVQNLIRGIASDSRYDLELVIVIETIVDNLSQADLLSILEAPETKDDSRIFAVCDLSILSDHADAYDYEIDPMCSAVVNKFLLPKRISKDMQDFSAN
ncbi:hypothetical protein [Comamonas testosteroni]|uniref:hypothetical protein n=1 Tax=Comamonas testosteroni TaxID=285 RepID=UPI0012D33F25|nr:hypothetical protein [Comamonas testosteroni]